MEDILHHAAFELWHWKLLPRKLSRQHSTSDPKKSLPQLPVSLLMASPSGLPAHVPVWDLQGESRGQAASWG